MTWAVIQPHERDEIIAAVHRETVRATVSIGPDDLDRWARQRGMATGWRQQTRQAALDAYIAAQYAATDPTSAHPGPVPRSSAESAALAGG